MPMGRILNKITEHDLRQLQVYMEIFRSELSFIINNTDISNIEVFEFIKLLSSATYMMKDMTLDYDDTKQLARFFGAYSQDGMLAQVITRKMSSRK